MRARNSGLITGAYLVSLAGSSINYGFRKARARGRVILGETGHELTLIID